MKEFKSVIAFGPYPVFPAELLSVCLKDSVFTSAMEKFVNKSHFMEVKWQFVRCLCALDKCQRLTGG